MMCATNELLNLVSSPAWLWLKPITRNSGSMLNTILHSVAVVCHCSSFYRLSLYSKIHVISVSFSVCNHVLDTKSPIVIVPSAQDIAASQWSRVLMRR